MLKYLSREGTDNLDGYILPGVLYVLLHFIPKVLEPQLVRRCA